MKLNFDFLYNSAWSTLHLLNEISNCAFQNSRSFNFFKVIIVSVWWSSTSQEGCLSRGRKTPILKLCCLVVISKHGESYWSKSRQKMWSGVPKAVDNFSGIPEANLSPNILLWILSVPPSGWGHVVWAAHGLHITSRRLVIWRDQSSLTIKGLDISQTRRYFFSREINRCLLKKKDVIRTSF